MDHKQFYWFIYDKRHISSLSFLSCNDREAMHAACPSCSGVHNLSSELVPHYFRKTYHLMFSCTTGLRWILKISAKKDCFLSFE